MDPITLALIGVGIWLFVQAVESGTQQQVIGVAADGTPIVTGVSMTTSGGKLSAAGLAQLAANAGFQGNDLVTAVAIALAESGGNPGVVGDQNITPGGSVGLWQINLHYHPEYTAQELVDPQTNADAAFAIYSAAGNSFTPWSTFKTGAYTAYLGSAQDGSDVVA